MTRYLIIVALVCLAGCAAPSDYAYPPALEMNILDTMTVVFIDPDKELQPTRVLMSLVSGEWGHELVGICYWEEWVVDKRNQDRGVWVMAMKPLVTFRCDEASIRDSLLPRSIDLSRGEFKFNEQIILGNDRTIRGNEDRKLWEGNR